MSVMRFPFALIVAVGIAGFTGRASAQGEGGLDSLLEDITTSPAPAAVDAAAPAVESAAAPANEAEVAPVAAPEVAPVSEAPAAEAVVAPVETPSVVEPAVEVASPAEEPVAKIDDLAGLATEPQPVPVVQQAEVAPAVEGEPAAVPVVDEQAVTEAPAAAAAEEVVADPNAPLPEGATPSLLAQQEEVRRQAKLKDGKKNLEQGMADLRAGRLDDAIKKLQDAQAKIPVLSTTTALIEQARAGLGDAYTRKAQEAMDRGDLKNARMSLGQSKPFVPAGSTDSMERKLTRAEERAAVEAARPIPVKKRPDFVEREKSIKELLNEGRQFYEAGDYNAAEADFEKVLIKDEYNVDAMRFLRRLDEKRYAVRSKEREATEADMMQRVRDTWNPPVYEESKTPRAAQNRGVVETKTSAQKLQEKMEQIIIPSIEFRQANINDVVNFLVEASIQGDKAEGTGVNIILNLSGPGGEAASPAPTPAATTTDFGGGGGEFGDLGSAPAEAPSSTSGLPTITLNLRRISLLDAIKYITEVARLKFRLEENAVMITPEGIVSGRVITRLYPVQPSIIDVVVERGEAPERGGDFTEMGSTRSTIKKSDVKEFFEKAGVPFPQGTSITYNPTISQLIVANTPENLEVFERILSRLNVIPNQVEIEARFVEISQDDLEELGFQWILTDNWEMATKNGGSGMLGGQQQIVGFADAAGVTKGLRFFAQDNSSGSINPLSAATLGSGTPLGNIFSMGGILTNPELSVVIQALSQHGGTDLLSAPRVTTRSGVNAQIQVVREIIYPTEFETQQPSDNTFNGGGTGGSQTIVATPPLIYPGAFQTREVGVILNVTPTVGPDGYTIDLTMVPEVAELVDWIQYGYTQGGVLTANIPQPVFASRNVTTSIIIWDGQTVVMGGLIREDLVKVKDKIPVLGDIPLLGRLFRSEGQYSKKKNLLIFVTARLVDPAGKPIHRGEPGAVDAGTAETAAAKP